MFKKALFLICSIGFIHMALAFKTTSKTFKYIPVSQGISFIEQDWDKALLDAKANHKLIFLDIYATWCGPCKMLKKNTFTDKTVAEFFNTNFINVSINGEKGVGPTLVRQYQIQGYPTLIIADDTGKPLLYTVGYIDNKTILDFAKAALAKK